MCQTPAPTAALTRLRMPSLASILAQHTQSGFAARSRARPPPTQLRQPLARLARGTRLDSQQRLVAPASRWTGMTDRPRAGQQTSSTSASPRQAQLQAVGPPSQDQLPPPTLGACQSIPPTPAACAHAPGRQDHTHTQPPSPPLPRRLWPLLRPHSQPRRERTRELSPSPGPCQAVSIRACRASSTATNRAQQTQAQATGTWTGRTSQITPTRQTLTQTATTNAPMPSPG